MREKQMITAHDLKRKNTIDFSKSAKEFSSTNFWYYTAMSTVNEILYSESFWVSNIANMNDENEAQFHDKEKDKVFALCFCNSNSEKIPMWYLYSGICGTGMRIGITPANMLKMISSIKHVSPVINNELSENQLEVGKDIEIEYGWVYYKSHSSQIQYRNKWYEVSDLNSFVKNNFFIKDYPWQYEREFRIVFKNCTNMKFDKLAVSIPHEMIKALKITCAPECQYSCYEGKGFEKYFSSLISPSKLKINMDLLKRNKDSIVSNFDKIIDEKNVDELCRAINNFKRKSKNI